MSRITLNIRTDYSTLFNSLGSSKNTDIFSSGINLSDYADIKSGSYGKLLKAYYAKQKAEAGRTKVEAKDKQTKKEKESTATGKAIEDKNSKSTKKLGYTNLGTYVGNSSAGNILDSIV